MAKGIKIKRDTKLCHGQRKHIPIPTGPLKIVGARDIMIGSSKLTGLLVRLYYPAANQNRDIRDHYLMWPNWLPNENYRSGYTDVASLRFKCLKNAFGRYCGNRFIPVIPNAKPLREKGRRWPVIVFSHGLGGCRTTYSAICLEFASHGFIVAAVEHRDGSACCTFYAKEVRLSMYGSQMRLSQSDLLDDSSDHEEDVNANRTKSQQRLTFLPQVNFDWIPFKAIKSDENQYATRNKQIYHRVRECSRTLDLLEALNNGFDIQNLMDQLLDPTEFEGIIDLDAAVMAGHSMGAATTLLALTSELRFKAGICLDPWMYPIGKESIDSISQPLLIINTDTFHTKANLKKIKELFPSSGATRRKGSRRSTSGAGFDDVPFRDDPGRQLVTIKSSVHYNQSDIPFVLNWFARKMFGATSSRNRFTAIDLTTSLSIDFLSHHLLDASIAEDPQWSKDIYLNLQKKKLKHGLPSKI